MSEAAKSQGHAPAAGEPMERVLEGRTPALTLLNAMRAVTRFADRIYLGMGHLCGGIFLMLGLFITYQVIARKVGWAMAPGQDPDERLRLGNGRHLGFFLRSQDRLPCANRRAPAFHASESPGNRRLAGLGFHRVLRGDYRLGKRGHAPLSCPYEIDAVSATYPLTPFGRPKRWWLLDSAC